MNGYQITFFTRQDRRHRGRPLADWLVHLAGELGLRGATLIPASEGIGHDHRLHAARFFELTDQPLCVLMAVTAGECARLFERIEAEGVAVFYVKTAAEFGATGSGNDAQ